jgi:hypothetical protein
MLCSALAITTVSVFGNLAHSNSDARRRESREFTNADRFGIGPFLSLGQQDQTLPRDHVFKHHNLMYNKKVKMHRYAINRGEAVVISDPSFKTFNLEFDFKYLSCHGVKIDNYCDEPNLLAAW